MSDSLPQGSRYQGAKLTKLAHIMIRVRDLDTSTRFYPDALTFEVKARFLFMRRALARNDRIPA